MDVCSSCYNQKPCDCPDTWDHVGAQGPCCSWGRTDLSDILPGSRVTSGDIWTRIAARDQSGSMALLQIGSVLMSMTPVAVEGHADSTGLGHNLCPCWCLVAMLRLGPYRSGGLGLLPEAMVSSRARLLLQAMPGPYSSRDLG